MTDIRWINNQEIYRFFVLNKKKNLIFLHQRFIHPYLDIMKRIFSTALVFFIAAGIFAGCASTKKAAQHPLVGMWDYSVDTPDGTYNGVVTIMEAEGVLSGVLTNDALPGEMELSGLMFEDNKVTFKFDSGEVGILTFNANVMEDKMEGSINIDGFGEMPVKGQKKMADM